MAKYRKLVKRFWTDPRVYELTPVQKVIFSYLITGTEACSSTQISGIYEISRGALAKATNIDIEEVTAAMNYFNEKKSMLLEFDDDHHMVFIKSFYKYNSTYKSSVASLMEDFKDTFHKAPSFWAEFGEKYRPEFSKIYPMLELESYRDFLDRLFELKNHINSQPLPNPVPKNFNKITSNNQKTI